MNDLVVQGVVTALVAFAGVKASVNGMERTLRRQEDKLDQIQDALHRQDTRLTVVEANLEHLSCNTRKRRTKQVP